MTIESIPAPAVPAPAVPAPDEEIRPLRTLDELEAALSGSLLRPGDVDWDEARRAWQLLVDQRPAAVVVAANRHDVVLTVRTAAALGLRVAAQSTGHNAGPLGDLSRTILLRTAALDGVQLDPERRCAVVEAGATWGGLAAEASTAGLAAVGGFAADVGVIGLLLGGGLGWFARSHGAAADHVIGFEAVTADGVVRRLDPAHEPELFAALLRGADVAIILSVELRLHRIGEVVAGALFWPVEEARHVFHAWAEWTAELPEPVTSVVRVLRFPDAPGVPPVFAGRAFAIIEAVVQGSLAAADRVLEPLRLLAPAIDTFAPTAPAALAGLHMDPPQPVPAVGTSTLLTTMPPIDGLVDAIVDGDARVLTSVELRHLGGALARGGADGLAEASALLFAVAIAADPDASAAPDPNALAAAARAFDALAEAVAPVRSPRDASGFTEVPAAPERLWGVRLDELRAVKRAWDPNDLVHANHPVLPRVRGSKGAASDRA